MVLGSIEVSCMVRTCLHLAGLADEGEGKLGLFIPSVFFGVQTASFNEASDTFLYLA
jgi:hypothetical protein